MEQGRELYIETGIHSLVDIVYSKTYRTLNPDFKRCLQITHIKLDASIADGRQYLPPFDCLYYPTVNPKKCTDDYDGSDWVMFEQELEKYTGKPLPTFQYYKLNRLTNELCYFLKLAIHATLNPQEGIGTWGFDYFIRHYSFISANFPDKQFENDYEDLWCDLLENLKTDRTNMRMGYDGNFYPLGQFILKQIDWLKAKIGCG